ncbi:MAG: hypothetical protein F4Y02_00445 [Chloroflexi bacterium]|nr:hypothetical protein [Chloroflexota bacterium]
MWMLVVAPLSLPLVVLAARTLWSEARSATQRVLLISTAAFAAVPLVLDSVPMPIRIAEEGSEQMAAVVLISVLLSVLGWVPLSRTFVTWRFVSIVAVFTALVAGILDAREYDIRVAGATRDLPEIHHDNATSVSQILQVDRAHLSRIDVFAASSGGSADLFLRLAPPGHPPIRESRTTTSHPRWSNRPVTFVFPPIADSAGQTYELIVGVLQPEPIVFLGLSNDNPIPESNVFLHGKADVWSNDLALRAYTPGRGFVWLVSMIQDRDFIDVLMGVEVFIAWLWGVVLILWWTASGVRVNKGVG